jgi:hypothetical protein
MVVETNHLDQVRVTALVVILQVLLYDLLESINDELFLKGWIGLFRLGEFLIGLVLVLRSLKVEKGKTQS